MPIPKNRAELVGSVTTTFTKLREDLASGGDEAGTLVCVDEWTVKDVLVVRAWWTRAVVRWIEAGRLGQVPALPAEGYRWSETPRLNQDLIDAARGESYRSVRERLEAGFEEVMHAIESLSDQELLVVGAFEWAGKWPLSRWISINTARQYTTARTYLRRAQRGAKGVTNNG